MMSYVWTNCHSFIGLIITRYGVFLMGNKCGLCLNCVWRKPLLSEENNFSFYLVMLYTDLFECLWHLCFVVKHIKDVFFRLNRITTSLPLSHRGLSLTGPCVTIPLISISLAFYSFWCVQARKMMMEPQTWLTFQREPHQPKVQSTSCLIWILRPIVVI